MYICVDLLSGPRLLRNLLHIFLPLKLLARPHIQREIFPMSLGVV